MKKIIIAILLIIILISVYLFFFPRITVNEIEVSKSIPVKILPYKDYTNKKNDSLLVYLPYKIQIVNYSTTILKKPNFYFKSINYDHHPQFMIYDKNGINVEGLSTDGLTLEELYSRGKLFPLLPKTFYVYKYNIIPAKALNISLDSITYKKIVDEFLESKENLHHKTSIQIPQKIVDSLYDVENKKNMHINFLSKSLWKVKFNPSKRKSEFEDLYKLTKEQAYPKLSQPIE